MRALRTSLSSAVPLLGICVLCLAGASKVEAASFNNPTTISLNPVGGQTGPYPSSITVSNLPGIVTNVTVTLTNLFHTRPDDIDVLLVGPGGQRILLMSDAGGTNQATFVRLTFSDAATGLLPDAAQIVTGNYRPSNYGGGDTFPAPAPAGPYTNSFAVFDGTNPNGTWQLFANDDTTGSASGSIGGWHLNLFVDNRPPVIVSQPQDVTALPGDTVSFEVGVSGTPPFGYQWMRNGQVFVPFGQGGKRLTLSSVSPNDAGFYSVIISNAANRDGVASRQARLDVNGPLIIVEPPSTVTPDPGETVRLSVVASGTPPLLYQWTLNGAVLPDETNSTLTLPRVNALSGGNYQVVVRNAREAVTTPPALVLVRAATGPSPTDRFADRPRLQGSTGVLQGNSAQARTENGEIVARGGGRTMWFEWLAPEDGILSLTSRGSTFDTMLAVFTGVEVNALNPVTRDDDQGGFFTSSFQFNARKGTRYQIQVDGLGVRGTGGEYTVSWNFEASNELVPVMLLQPEPQAVVIGDSAVFRVITEDQGDQFQWFFNGRAIRGAVENTLTIPSAKSDQVGFYSVRIVNRFGRILLSPQVVLQIGSLPLFGFFDKFETVAYSYSIGEFVPIGLGVSLFQQVPSLANRSVGDPNPCGKILTATLWQGLSATNSGVMQIDSFGSEILARMAVYRFATNAGILSSVELVCDLSSAESGVPAVFEFNAQRGSNYIIVAEGFGGSGNLKINSTMGYAPTPTNQLKYYFVPEGGSFVLSMPAADWVPAPACQWRFNGVDMPGETGASLTVNNFSALQVGTYSVQMSNFVRTVTRDVGNLALAGPFQLNHWWSTNAGVVDFVINASNASPFLIETTTNLNNPWIPIATNQDPTTILLYTNPGALTDPQRFFRAAPWPPAGP